MKNKIKLELAGIDGNAFSIMGTFRKAAKKQGWSDSEISAVLDNAMSGDYNNLLAVILSHCE